MSFFGFKSAKEVEKEKQQAAAIAATRASAATRDAIEYHNRTSLSNLGKGSQIKFAIPFFDVFDPQLMNYGVPCTVHGSIVYAINDIDQFRQINKTENYSDEAFQDKLRGTVTKYVKGVVTNAPSENQIPVIQIERKIIEISALVQQHVVPQVERLFGITVRSLDITKISIDKSSRGFRELNALTADLEKENMMAQHKARLDNFNLQNEMQQSNMRLQNSLNQDQLKAQSALGIDAMQRQQELTLGGQEELQAMQLENQRETMRIQREEMQRAARLQTEQTFLGAHQANLSAGIINNATENGLDAFAQQQALGGGMLGGGMPQMPQMPAMGAMPQMPAAKSVPQVQYMVGVNGQPAGPFDWNQLTQLVQSGHLTQQTQVWTQGMPQWAMAGQVQELLPLFQGQAPAMGGMPGMPSL